MDPKRSRRLRAWGVTPFAIALMVGVLIVGLLAVQPVAGQSSSSTDIEQVFGQFTKLDRQLTRAIDRAEKGESTESLIRQIQDGKLAIVDQQMSSPIDGVAGSRWYRSLDCVDKELLLAQLVEQGHLTVPHGGITGANRQLINEALKKAKTCKQHLERDLHQANETTPPPQPSLKPIHAAFSPAPPGQPCSPPYCTTVYTEDATGQDLHYAWTVSIPADPGCAKGFQPNKPQANQATWYHADVSEGGYCNHSVYDPSGSGHPGTVTVTVTNANWSCTATFYGTQGPQAQVTWDGPEPQPCRRSQ